MMRRWVGVAMIAGCLSLAQAAHAQLPPAPGASPLPEPIPFGSGPGQEPNLVPGPISPQAAPEGPPDNLSLPADGTGAFPCKEVELEEAWYFHLGAQAWRRQGLGNGVIAVRDPQSLDTGAPPPANAPVLQKFGQLDPRFNTGVRATFGCLFEGNQSLELTGYYIFEHSRTTRLADPGRIDSFFFNPPLGFEGDNGLWRQADRISTTLQSTLWDTEVNYRWANPALLGAELIVGGRYLDLTEKLSTFTDDDGLSFPLANGQPDPHRTATYNVQTENRFFGPQLGYEWAHSVTPLATVGFGAKGAWGADYIELKRSLVRGDGFSGFGATKDRFQFSHLYEFNAYVDFHLLERARLRFGYNAMWFLHMGNVVDQYDFNLQDTSRQVKQNGNIFFHGPQVEFQFLF